MISFRRLRKYFWIVPVLVTTLYIWMWQDFVQEIYGHRAEDVVLAILCGISLFSIIWSANREETIKRVAKKGSE